MEDIREDLYKLIQGIARRYGNRLGIEEDLEQDMLVMVLEGENPISFRRRIIDMLRSRRYKYTSYYDIVYNGIDLIPTEDHIIDHVILNSYLESLNQRDREVIQYRLAGYEYREIAKLTGLDKSKVCRIVNKLSREWR